MHSNHWSGSQILFQQFKTIEQPDIVIVEGVNILQFTQEHLFDFIIYVDADTDMIKSWYIC